MFDLGPHAGFIVAAYAVTAIAVGGLLLATLADDRRQRRMLAELERQGIRRRSAAPPATPAVKATAKKKAVTKPRARKTSTAPKKSPRKKTAQKTARKTPS
jgi:heme exporter protein D